jgi:hypothetical protein
MEAVPSPVPLSIEPVLGWRVWRLSRRDDGSLALVSATRSDEWPAREAASARCYVHHGEPAPGRYCQCGLYAASTPEALATSQIYSDATTVVGAVAMWGTVIEHTRGVRAATSYPARLLLVCALCLREGRGGIAPSLVVGSSSLIAVCRRHSLKLRGPSVHAADVQAELLSTYAVDPVPLERVAQALKTPRDWATASPRDLGLRLIEAVFALIGFVFQAVMALFLLAWFVGLAFGILKWLAGLL